MHEKGEPGVGRWRRGGKKGEKWGVDQISRQGLARKGVAPSKKRARFARKEDWTKKIKGEKTKGPEWEKLCGGEREGEGEITEGGKGTVTEKSSHLT